ncbi:MAG: amino acid adenylation domain-containing protein [Pirellulaceae bacterium]
MNTACKDATARVTTDSATAYVMFTSGSTGRPKGVTVSHASVLALLDDPNEIAIARTDVVAQASNRAFDACTYEIWGALLRGAVLASVNRDDLLSADQLSMVLRRYRITRMFVTTALFNMLADQDPCVFSELDTLLFGGERASRKAVMRVCDARPPNRLVHVYGPTETTVFATSHLLTASTAVDSIPIGRGIVKDRCYVLDQDLEPVPIGIDGELFIGGCGVAVGYHGASGLTAASFLPDPFSDVPGSRMFRTNDIVRMDADGTLTFLRRSDDQIKIRGFRVEPGEIESQLERHPLVRAAIVTAFDVRPDRDENMSLTAWVEIPKRPIAGPANLPVVSDLSRELRLDLEKHFPIWMCPSRINVLERFPRTDNGKIDRQALLVSGSSHERRSSDYTPPTTADERALCAIFCELLNIDGVGVDDDFFALGGHSLIATQLASRIRSRLYVSLPIAIVFQCPTPRLLSTQVQSRRDMLAAERRPTEPLPAARHDGIYPASFAQQRLWFLQQLEPESASYNIPIGSRIVGAFNPDAMLRAMNVLIERHDSLRTVFDVRDGQVVQIVAPRKDCDYQFVDLTENRSSFDETESRARALAVGLMEQPFDLQTDCVVRMRILKVADSDHILLICLHHIAADGWSLGVLIRELLACYHAFRDGNDISFPALPIQYADFAVWQRETLVNENFDEMLTWWRRRLEGVEVLRLPTDYPRPENFSGKGKVVSRLLSHSLERSLRTLAESENATLFMALLAGFQVLLYRYTGQTDIAVGCPIANRNRSVLEGLIGFFVNSFVMRSDLAGDPPFNQLLRQVRDMAIDAYDRQDLPFEQLVDSLQPVRDSSRNPLFDVTFAVQNAPLHVDQLPGWRAFEFDVTSVRFDLEIDVRQREDGLVVHAFYREELFADETIERMLHHLENLLSDFAVDPTQRISDAGMLCENELQRNLAHRSSSTSPPSTNGLHGLFEQQAQHTPDRIAAACDSNSLSYRELDQRANQIAFQLISAGVSAETAIAIPGDRSIDMLVGILGILKAGAVCMPIEIDLPDHRIQSMFRQARVGFVLSRERMVSWPESKWIPLDAMQQASLSGDLPIVSGDNAAFLFFTSGSTGVPSGVILTHQGLSDFVKAVAERLKLSPNDSILQFASPGFDVIVEELFPIWLSGGKVVAAQTERFATPEALNDLIDQWAISIIELPAVFWRVWVDDLATDHRSPPSSLKTVLVGCEQPDVPRLHWWRQTDCKLYTVFGLSETSVTSSMQKLPERDEQATTHRLSLGVPLTGACYYVLDVDLNLVPPGATGELFIGGASLARGYLADPVRTALRFLPDRFSSFAGARMYRTGDIVRLRSDGQIDFLGRRDHQYNVRGFRIEAEEVESALRRSPLVTDAAVVVHGKDEHACLVGYIACNEEQPIYRRLVTQTRHQHWIDWQAFYEQVYTSSNGNENDELAGWTSSFTGEPIPAAGMYEQVQQTVDRMLRDRPAHVLEIGCGNGLLLRRVAPHCRRYVATDLSSTALRLAADGLDQEEYRACEVLLLQDSMFDIGSFQKESFDLICLNSVVQHFPDIEALNEWMDRLVPLVSQGGSILLGDVRLQSHACCFNSAVELFRSKPGEDLDVIRQRIAQRAENEPDLLIEQSWLASLEHRFKRLRDVQVLPKRGDDDNELCRYRFDVFLRFDVTLEKPAESEWIDWNDAGLSIHWVRDRLAEHAPERLLLRNVPNARVCSDHDTMRNLFSGRHQTLEALVGAGETRKRGTVHPETLWSIAEGMPYEVDVRLSADSIDALDVAILRIDTQAPSSTRQIRFRCPFTFAEEAAVPAITPPVHRAIQRAIASEVRNELQQHLPYFMIPSHFVFLHQLPLNVNGKLDRRALPPPNLVTLDASQSHLNPTTTESMLLRIWSDLLQKSVHDVDAGFFELGGHSLLAVQVAARIGKKAGVVVPLRAFFDFPTIRELALFIDHSATNSTAEVDPSIPRFSRDREQPLSFGQERLWFLNQLDPESCAYLMPIFWRLRGEMNVEAFRLSIECIVKRHESLRTTFPEVMGNPTQRIHDTRDIDSIKIVDMTEVPQGGREQSIQDAADAELATPIRLIDEFPFRCRLLRYASDDHVLLMTLHHIVSDGWSVAVLADELAQLYSSLLHRSPVVLPPLRTQYVDFAAWQRDIVGSQSESHREFWHARLVDAEPFDLPTDFVRRPKSRRLGKVVSCSIDDQQMRQLTTISTTCDSSLFITLLTAFFVLLGKVSRRRDVIVGTAVANRSQAELESLIGFFVNTLVMRCGFSTSTTFRELIHLVREQFLEAMAHHEYPFEKLVESLQVERSLTRNPFFQVTFAFEPASDRQLGFGGLDVQPLAMREIPCRFDLELHVLEQSQGAQVVAVYDQELFTEATIESWLASFKKLVNDLALNPDQLINSIGDHVADNCSSMEQEQNIPPLSESKCAHHLFAEIAAKQSEKTAVRCGTGSYTYAQIESKANALAARMDDLCIRSGDRICLAFDRSAEFIIAVLACWKIGAAYVPLDPMLPIARLRNLVDSSEAALLLCDNSTASLASSLADNQSLINVSDDHTNQSSGSFEPVESDIETLAYVIYTSGTTGRPKGVAVSHRSLVWQLIGTHKALQTLDTDIWSAVHSFSFDYSVHEIWGALLTGGSVAIANEEVRRSPAAICDFTADQSVSVLSLTPSAFSQLLSHWERSVNQGEELPRLICLGGEPLPVESLRRWRAFVPQPLSRLINLYGTTETTVIASAYAIADEEFQHRRYGIPIGEPLHGSMFYILDRDGNLVPPGGLGELFIGGPNIARGYWNEPRATAERFIPNPWGPAGTRLYRTGDLARQRGDGLFEYCGRVDDQVQIRGYRVEPDEIAACLHTHDLVEDAAVIALKDRSADGAEGEVLLTAYVVPASMPTSTDFRHAVIDFLRQKLPPWMLPRSIHVVEELPRTVQGKLDRKRLPEESKVRLDSQPYRPPRDNFEQMVAEVWRDVLQNESIDVNDNFFLLGGHSLLASQIVARLRAMLQCEIPLRLLFESPTVAAFAKVIRGRSRASATTSVIEKVDRTKPHPLSDDQRRLWFLSQLDPEDASYNVPIAIRIRGSLDKRALAQSLDFLTRRHEAFRTRIVMVEGQPMQQIQTSGERLEDVIDLKGLSGSERQRDWQKLVETEEVSPFQLNDEPLYRIHLVEMTQDETIVLFTMHHILCDGWSANILLAELATSYEAFSRQAIPDLPELPIQYVDYAAWRRHQEANLKTLHWWRQTLMGARATALPSGKSASDRISSRADSIAVTIPNELVGQMDAFCRDQAASPFMLLLSALAVTLVRQTGQHDLSLGTPVANRGQFATDGVIGFFVNMLTLRIRCDIGMRFSDIVGQVRQIVLDALDHQDVSFDQVVQTVHPDRPIDSHPLFNILFSVQTFPDRKSFDDARMSQVGLEIKTTRYDMELLAWDHRRRFTDDGKSIDDDMTLSAVYRCEKYDAASIQHLLEGWREVLAAAMKNPASRVDQLFASTLCKQTLDASRGATPTASTVDATHDAADEQRLAAVPKASTLKHRIERWVQIFAEQHPEKIAVADSKQTITYRQLYERSESIATCLRSAKVKPEGRVGLCIDRGVDAIVAMVGVLKANAVYVPLTHQAPASWLANILRESGVEHLLVGSGCAPPPTNESVRCLDFEEALSSPQSGTFARSIDDGNALAYVMFTSGSTGRPKAVGVRHASIESLVRDTDYAHFASNDIVAQIADIAFDGSTFEIWGAILNGATLQIVDQQTLLSSGELKDCFDRLSITTAFLPTALFHQLIADQPNLLESLQYAIIGGERLDATVVRGMLDHRPRKLVNGYGPTETTTFATAHLISRVAENVGTISIGKPIANVECFVLDADLSPVLPGQRGELYIGGTGVSRGYVNDARLTAERFIPHPFSDQPGARIYRTGDEVIWRPSGTLDFCGRRDRQVKIRGHRVELAEIEAAAHGHPDVEQAVVVAHEDTRLDVAMTCYIVSANNHDGRNVDSFVQTWRTLYEDLYEQRRDDFQPDLHLIGWNSSYTGEPLSADLMREQIDQTVRRIQRHSPQRILEIGCGTGLLLFRLAGQCEQYVGTDFSAGAIKYVKQHLPHLIKNPENVELHQRTANELDDFSDDMFDLVIINSVAQYLPSGRYLQSLVRTAARLVRSGGHVFIGDVRSLSTLELYHCSVALSQADDDMSCQQLRCLVNEAVRKEDELLVDPRFFLTRLSPFISDARIELKEGKHDSELTQFRYDVTLSIRKQDSSDSVKESTRVRWVEAHTLSDDPLAAIERLLVSRPNSDFGIRGLRNARIDRVSQLLRTINDTNNDQTVAEICADRATSSTDLLSVHPESLWRLGEQHRLDVQISPNLRKPETFDVMFLSEGRRTDGYWRGNLVDGDRDVVADPLQWTNDPLAPVVAREFGERLMAHLRKRLPEYMLPNHFVMLERLPLTSNGKVDYRSLPAPPSIRVSNLEAFIAPVTNTELRVAAIWCEQLRVDRVGRMDNFFQLGGHSLLATQVVTRLCKEFAVKLPLRALFENQRVDELSHCIDELVRSGTSLRDVPIRQVSRDHDLPLSFAQQRLWFLEQLDPDRCSYNMPAALRLRGPLNVAALRHAFDQVVLRHEALRTFFPLSHGQPAQRVSSTARCEWESVDLKDLSQDERQRRMVTYVKLEESTPFDLTTGPLLRVRLLHCAADDWVLLMTMHHIISDGWSITILTRELGEFDAAFVEDRSPRLPKLPIQYADFSHWQRTAYEGKEMRRQLEYWRRQLSGIVPIRLPTDHVPPARRTFLGDCVTLELAPELSRHVREFSNAKNTTLFITLMAAFQVLISRWTGQYDLAIGTPIAGRNRQEIEGLIGFFVNSLVIRGDLQEDPTFDDFLAQMRETSIEAFANQDLPFEKLVEELRPDRTLTQNPLFQVLFAVQNATTVDFSLPELSMSVLEFDLSTTRFDLELHVWDGTTLSVYASYDTELFDRKTIERLLKQFERLLISIAEDSTFRVSQLAMLPAAEEEMLLFDWNVKSANATVSLFNGEMGEDGRGSTLNCIFHDVARRQAVATAVVDQTRELTYSQLDRPSNVLANRLVSRGLSCEECVGVCAGRSSEAVVGMLGVVKAGGAYVPLDPDWPVHRKREILSELNVRFCIVDPQTLLEPELDVDILMIQADDDVQQSEPPAISNHPDQLAYVLFTSGSSGKPKGVQVTHRNVIRLLEQTDLLFDFNADDVWSVLHAFTFDFSVWEIWGALLHGGSMVIASELARRSPVDCFELLTRHNVTVLNQTPTAFAQLASIDSFSPNRTSLRYIIFGGESLEPRILRSWFEACGEMSTKLVNMFGITETTVHVTFQEMHPQQIGKPASGSPIGKRLSDLQIYLLDRKMLPVPMGAIGEVYVGGEGLARGYWADPVLTAERFMPNPWGEPGSRIYRTGDLARYSDRETLEYWGRLDQQLKIRGYRIEPAEIENCLHQHSSVRDVLVTTHAQPNDDVWLVAYVIRDPSSGLSDEEIAGELHNHARQYLPVHMLPRSYVSLDQFPLTPNGKVNRRLLPTPSAMRPELSRQFVPPDNEIEEMLAAIWRQVVSLDRVGRYDNFFELGGHSLLATQVVSRIRDQFGIELPLRALFENPSISTLAKLLEGFVGAEVPRQSMTVNEQQSGGKRHAALSRLRKRRKQAE